MDTTEPKQRSIPFVRGSSHTSSASLPPLARRFPDTARNHFVAMSGEFIGTFLFLFFGFVCAQVANNIPSTQNPNGSLGPPVDSGPNPLQLLYIALGFGFSLAVNVWIFYRISGGLFNPAVCQPSYLSLFHTDFL
jgi:aquaporin related protein